MDVAALVLRPGDSVSAEGIVVTDGNDFGLLLSPSMLELMCRVVLDHPAIVRLTGAPTTTNAWPGHPPHISSVHGTWDGTGLVCEEVRDSGPASYDAPQVPDEQPRNLLKALQDLSHKKLLSGISITSSPEGRSAHVTTSDPSAASLALEAHFVDVKATHALHDDSERDELTRTLLAVIPDELLASFGQSTGTDGHTRVTVTVKYVTIDIYHAIKEIPESILHFTSLLTPSSAPLSERHQSTHS
jgi:hypothetical protein